MCCLLLLVRWLFDVRDLLCVVSCVFVVRCFCLLFVVYMCVLILFAAECEWCVV